MICLSHPLYFNINATEWSVRVGEFYHQHIIFMTFIWRPYIIYLPFSWYFIANNILFQKKRLFIFIWGMRQFLQNVDSNSIKRDYIGSYLKSYMNFVFIYKCQFIAIYYEIVAPVIISRLSLLIILLSFFFYLFRLTAKLLWKTSSRTMIEVKQWLSVVHTYMSDLLAIPGTVSLDVHVM